MRRPGAGRAHGGRRLHPQRRAHRRPQVARRVVAAVNDAVILVAAMGFVCLAFALMAALADWWESADRADARERNHVRRQR